MLHGPSEPRRRASLGKREKLGALSMTIIPVRRIKPILMLLRKMGWDGRRKGENAQQPAACAVIHYRAQKEGTGWLLLLGRGKRSECVEEAEEEGLQLLFPSCEQRAHLGPMCTPSRLQLPDQAPCRTPPGRPTQQPRPRPLAASRFEPLL